MRETKAAFAGRTIRSLKNIQYRYLEDYGYRYILKLSQKSTTLNYRKKMFGRLDTKKIRNSDFLSIPYNKPTREYRKPKFKSGNRICISRYDLPFRKVYKPKYTQEVFEIVALSSKKPPTFTIEDRQDEIIRGIFYRKELIKVILQRNCLQNSWFQIHLRNYFQTIH